MQQTADWLIKRDMSEYAERSTENDIDTAVLPDLTDQHRKDLGVSLGHRSKMLRAMRDLANGLVVAAAPSGPAAAEPTRTRGPHSGSASSRLPANPVAVKGPPWLRNKARIARSQLGSMPAPEPRRSFRLSRKLNLRREIRVPHPCHRRSIGQDGSERYYSECWPLWCWRPSGSSASLGSN